jgi:hypothetical protein
MNLTLTPGAFVRNPACPEWGDGQIQSVIGHRATVNFEHQGKLVLDLRHVRLEPIEREPTAAAGDAATPRSRG